MKNQNSLLLFIMLLIAVSCGNLRDTDTPQGELNESEILLAYLEENGNLINSASVPALVDADYVAGMLHGNNIHIIDLRPAREYAAGHIEHSVNIEPGAILEHFEQRIEPNSFELIVLVCQNAMLSTYVNSVMLLMGYDNVVSLRYGLSSWDQEIAGRNWLDARSSHLEGRLETSPEFKNPPGRLPVINTGEISGYRILRARAKEVLAMDTEELNKGIEDVMEEPDSFYIINYWPQHLYNKGHLSSAIQYTPKSALHSDQYINTIPANRPVITYCYTGHHSGYVTAFLRLLGYDAYNLPYGANSFIYDTMQSEMGGFRSFTTGHIHGLPLSAD